MNFIDVALISPPTYASSGKLASLGGAEHLGLEYLAAALEKSGYTVEIFNFEENDILPSLAVQQISAINPLIIGISPTSFSMEWTEEFCSLNKQINKTPILVGGHLATHMGEVMLVENPNIDIVSIGESEKTICLLVDFVKTNRNKLNEIPSIVYRDELGIIQRTKTAGFEDINNLPWPKHPHLNGACARVLTSRGCPFNCDFCTTPAFYGNNIRYRNVEDTIDEMLFLREHYNVNRFFFSDDSFVNGTQRCDKRLNEFIDLIQMKLPGIEFRCEIRADIILKKFKLIERLYQVGMKYVFVGLESSLDKDLDIYNKKVSSDTISKVPQLLRDLGVSIVPGFIMFNRSTSFEDVSQKIDFLFSLSLLYRTTYFSRTCMGYPGSSMFQKMKAHNDYDASRSTKYVLYPKFQIAGTHILSQALELVEQEYTEIDSIMLNSVIYKFDDYKYRHNIDNNTIDRIEEAEKILFVMQCKYKDLLFYAINMIKESHSNIPPKRIVDLFMNQYKSMKSYAEEFSTLVTPTLVQM